MSKKPATKTQQPSKTKNPPKPNPPAATPTKRGRPVKEPPPPKLWRIEALSPEGLKVTLGRYVTKEEAEPEFNRLQEDGFYQKLKMVESPPESEETSA